MLQDIALILLFGLIFYAFFQWLKLPGLIGLLLLGMVLGPYGLGWLGDELMLISGDIRSIALVVILLRAGLGLQRQAMKDLGFVTIKMSVLPVLIEGAVIVLLAYTFLSLSFIESGMLGFIIAAVSPAVIVPAMLELIKHHRGTKRRIPQLILASTSLDDVIAITIFTMFLSAGLTQQSWFIGIIQLPISLLLGVLLGLLVGWVFAYVFKRYRIRDSKKILLLLSAGIFLLLLEDFLSSRLPIAALLGVMAIGVVLTDRRPELAERLALKSEKIWIMAELFLFVLVGATVNIPLALDVGLLGVGLISAGLLGRGLGVYLATINSGFTTKERVFLAISFTPKATVQAAIGSLPLAFGFPQGELILALSVLSVLLTAPIGAIAIQKTQARLLA